MAIEHDARRYVRPTGQSTVEFRQTPQPSQSSSSQRRVLQYPQDKQYPSSTQPEPEEPISKQQMMQQSFLNYVTGVRGSAVNVGVLAGRRSRLDPDQQYVMQESGETPYGGPYGTGMTWSKGQILTGRQLQDIYTGEIKEYGKTNLAYQRYQQQTAREIRGYHPETTFRETLFMNRDPTKDVKGYVAVFPWEGAEKYSSLRQQLKKEGFLGLFRTSFSAKDPLGLYSAAYTFAGRKQEALDVKLQALHQFNIIKQKGIFSWEYAGYLAESPYTQLMISYGAGSLLGRGLGYASKVLTPGKALALNIGVGAAGGAMIVPAASSIHTKFTTGKSPEAVADIGLFIGNIYAGYRGFKPGFAKGQQYGFRARWTKEIGKMYQSKQITAEEYNAQMYLMRHKPEMFKILSDFSLSRPELRYGDVSTLQRFDEKGYMQDYLRVSLPKTRKVIVHGSVSRGLKQRFGDIDIMASPREKLNLEYAAKRTLNTWEDFMSGRTTKFSDIGHIHRIPRPGSIVTEQGGIALPYERVPSGTRITQMVDEFIRLTDQSIKPMHMGRVRAGKDVSESIAIIDRFLMENYASSKTQMKMEGFKNALTVLQRHYTKYIEKGTSSPFVTTETEGGVLYGKSFTERLYNLRYSFAKRTTSFRKLDIIFRKRYDPKNIRSLIRSDISVIPEERMPSGAAAYVETPQISSSGYRIYQMEPKIGLSSELMLDSIHPEGGYSIINRLLITPPIRTRSFGTIHLTDRLGFINRKFPQFMLGPEEALAHEFRHVLHPKATTMFGEYALNYRLFDLIPNRQIQGYAVYKLGQISKTYYNQFLPPPVKPTYSQFYGGYTIPTVLSRSNLGGYPSSSYKQYVTPPSLFRIKPEITDLSYTTPSSTPFSSYPSYKSTIPGSSKYFLPPSYKIPTTPAVILHGKQAPYKGYKTPYYVPTPPYYTLGYKKQFTGGGVAFDEPRIYKTRYKFREFKIPDLLKVLQ